MKNGCAKTYIKNLDNALGGGFPKGNNILLTGGPGCGKTIFSMQWLFNGYKKNKEKGLYIGFSEHKNSILRHMSQFSFFDEKLIDDNSIIINDFRYEPWEFLNNEYIMMNVKELNEGDIIETLKNITKQVKLSQIDRIVVDSISLISELVTYKLFVHDFFFHLKNITYAKNCTVLLIAEKHLQYSDIPEFGCEEFLADGVLVINHKEQPNDRVRILEILKMRGNDHSNKKFKLDINKDGILLSEYKDIRFR